MAERRMFAKSIVQSSKFLKMPVSSRELYFQMGMMADDDGVVEAWNAMMLTKAHEDDLRVLASKGFIQILDNEDMIAYLTDWETNNSIRKDRYHKGAYIELKAQVMGMIDNQVTTMCQPCDNQTTTEVRLGKVSIGKDRLGKVNKNEPKAETVYYPLDETLDKTFKDYIAMRKEIKKPMTDRAIELAMNKLEKLSENDNDIAIAILEQSIMNSWQGLFELKEKSEKTTSIVDKWQAAADELERRRNELN